MNKIFSKDMMKATELTRQGRLTEAVALIQRVLRGGSSKKQDQQNISEISDFQGLREKPAAFQGLREKPAAPSLLTHDKSVFRDVSV